jgi:hypothetical protein
MNEHLIAYQNNPYFKRAVKEVNEIFTESDEWLPITANDVRVLMILAWLRGAASHD